MQYVEHELTSIKSTEIALLTSQHDIRRGVRLHNST